MMLPIVLPNLWLLETVLLVAFLHRLSHTSSLILTRVNGYLWLAVLLVTYMRGRCGVSVGC